MGEVVIDSTVLTVTPIRAPQGQPMVQMVVGDPISGPVTMPRDVDRDVASIAMAIQRSLSQIGLSQQVGTPRLTLNLTEQEYEELGRPRYPDRITIALKVNP